MCGLDISRSRNEPSYIWITGILERIELLVGYSRAFEKFFHVSLAGLFFWWDVVWPHGMYHMVSMLRSGYPPPLAFPA